MLVVDDKCGYRRKSMHEGVWSTVLGLFGLMTIAVLNLPLSKTVKIPYTVLLALVGIIIGFLNSLIAVSYTHLTLPTKRIV